MTKIELANILSEILIPIGFKKKGNYWVLNGDKITKMINLQKSKFDNSFYINYGYILNNIPLDGMMHIYNRVASTDKVENLKIEELLNLESNVHDEERRCELKKVIFEKLILKVNSVNTEADILEGLKKQPHLNNIPMVVRQHFNLLD